MSAQSKTIDSDIQKTEETQADIGHVSNTNELDEESQTENVKPNQMSNQTSSHELETAGEYSVFEFPGHEPQLHVNANIPINN